MRLQLSRRLCSSACALLATIVATPAARADGELSVRGAYYKERSTRVQQPMVDARLDAGERGQVDAHFLVDAITSASTASGMNGAGFTEVRLEGAGLYTHDFGEYRLGGGFRLSDEPDYQSLYLRLRGEAAFAQDNTIFALGLAYGSDDIGNNNNTGISPPLQETLNNTLGSASITQVLGRTTVAGLTYDLMYADGFQANPYRSVVVAGEKQAELVPDTRLRQALFGSLRQFVPATKSTFVVGYRFYTDDWGITAHTPELRLVQAITAASQVRLRYRFYKQTAAEFYRDIYSEPQEFAADDPKLDAFLTHTLGITLGSELSTFGVTGTSAKWRAELTFEYINQTNRYGDALVGQVAVSVPFKY